MIDRLNQFFKSPRNRILTAIAALVLIAVWIFYPSKQESQALLVNVSKGEFMVDITTTGELEAKNSVEILGPSNTRNYRIWNMAIQDIIDEGTRVKKGDYVASLDPSELTNKIKDSQLELEKIESQFIQTKLDTTLEMRKSRDELINLSYGVDERELIVSQSKYEPPATIRQAEIELDKAKRALQQATENYRIKREQNAAKMQEVALNRQKELNNLNGMQDLLQEFTIIAPEDGMLIYKKDYDGKAIKKGSQIGAWNPVVATLPDLSTMISVTYINEVDIRKVERGQDVKVGLDAFPEKQFTGKVLSVANVGEQRPNSDAKVFRVTIEVNEQDNLLRPSMTTGNRIVTDQQAEALFIPLESLFNAHDSITYVYKKSGLGTIKQEVKIGISNRNEVIIEAGLTEGDKVFLSRQSALDDDSFTLIPEMNGLRTKGKTEKVEDVPAKEESTALEAAENRSGS